jgi:lysophospholipase L1-like esterase
VGFDVVEDDEGVVRRLPRIRRQPGRTGASHAVLVLAILGALALASGCQPWVDVRAVPVITATAVPAHTLHGEATTLTVVVSSDGPGAPVPTGTLTFPTLGSFTVTLIDGVFTWTGQVASFGTVTAPFDYSGDANYRPGSGALSVTIDVSMIPYSGVGPTVAMAGDSITFAAKPYIDERLQAEPYRHSVTGVLGVTTANGQPLLDWYEPTAPDVFVFALGTNDLSDLALGRSGEPGAALAALEARVVDAAARFPGSCFVVTTVSAHRSAAWAAPYAAYNDAALAFNAWLRATFPHVVDWEAAVLASLGAGTSILFDEVHPNLQGASVLADLVGQAADACVAPA